MAKKKKKKYSEKPKPPVTTQQTEEITKNPDNTETSNDGAVSQNQQEADTPDTAPVLENETVSSAEQPSAQDTVADKETAQADTNDNDDDDTVNFLLATSGLNISDCLFSLIAIYIIGNPRSGIAVYMSYLIFEMGLNHLAIFIFASLIAVSVSLVLSLKLGDSFSRLMGGVDYKKLSIGVILLQIVILYLFVIYYKAPVMYMTLALITSTAMGMLPHYIGIGKSHLMGVLIIPAIVIYMQMFI